MKITIEIDDKQVIAHLKKMIELEARKAKPPTPPPSTMLPVPKELMVGELGLTIRTENCLRGHNVRSVEQLVAITERELMRVPNLGKKALNEIKEVLHARGWHLMGEQR